MTADDPGAALGEGQEASVLAFLADRQAHGTGGGHGVERIDTHGAVVFLSGASAIKIKKAVRLPFLDFSTLAQRIAALAAELRLNRRTAPAIYRHVRAIVRRDDGSLGWAADGATPIDTPADGEVERALIMERFDTATRFDRLAARGALDHDLAGRLAEQVSALHAQADTSPSHGGLGGLADVIDGNDESLRAYPETLPPQQVARLATESRRLLGVYGQRLDARRDEGFVRRGHGDLHLGNICIVGGEPTLFDCLEFDSRLATTDILYDLAFLLMDLAVQGRGDLANFVLNRYRDVSPALCPVGDLELLPLFLATRAAVRAKIAAIQQADAGTEAGAQAQHYLAYALSVLTPRPPQLVAVGGLSGSGKSQLAYSLAPHLGRHPGALVLRSDMIRKAIMGVPWRQRLDERGYRSAITREVYRQIRALADAGLAAGYSVIVDAVHGNARERAGLAELAAARGAAFTGLWLQAPPRVLLDRVAGRVDDASDADTRIVKRQISGNPPPADWHMLDAARSPESILADAWGRLPASADNGAGP